jgi:hypothetical protein
MSEQQQQQERREECRREVLAFLADRSVLAFRAETIRNKLAREHQFSLDEINAALEFQISGGRVTREPDPDGATPFYKVTREGILHHERTP